MNLLCLNGFCVNYINLLSVDGPLHSSIIDVIFVHLIDDNSIWLEFIRHIFVKTKENELHQIWIARH